MMDPTEKQNPPQPNEGEAVWDLVVADMHARDRVGREEYGVPLQAHNGRDRHLCPSRVVQAVLFLVGQ